MRTLTLSFIASIFIVFNVLSQAIELELFATGLSDPINIKHAGDNRLFVVERDGIIKIINNNGIVNSTPFLDISNLILSGGERGLLGLAFHPNYANNGFFYVNYTNSNEDTVIARYSVSTNNPDLADTNSASVLLTINQPYSNHNGGDMAFGNDGYLYIATGDGGSGGDPENRAQDLSTLLGKMLRIDVDNGSPYGIPNDNPFANDGDNATLAEIWAYGLRNPWRFSFDKQTHDLWIADVGQNDIEEINMVALTDSGINYGWRCYEGNDIYNTSENCPNMSSLTFPVAQYYHSGNGPNKCSITGGYRYRGNAQPNMNGWYFFADYCSNEIGILIFNGTNWNITFTEQFHGNNWTSFGEDFNGEIYIAGINSGNIFKILSTDLSTEENSLSKINIYPNPANSHINISTNFNNAYQVNLYSVLGKKVASKTLLKKNEQISINNLQSGLYLIEIISNSNKKLFKKLIIK